MKRTSSSIDLKPSGPIKRERTFPRSKAEIRTPEHSDEEPGEIVGELCLSCAKRGPRFRCSHCVTPLYCNEDCCQRDYPVHMGDCEGIVLPELSNYVDRVKATPDFYQRMHAATLICGHAVAVVYYVHAFNLLRGTVPYAHQVLPLGSLDQVGIFPKSHRADILTKISNTVTQVKRDTPRYVICIWIYANVKRFQITVQTYPL